MATTEVKTSAAYRAAIATGALSPINPSKEDAVDAIYGARLVQYDA